MKESVRFENDVTGELEEFFENCRSKFFPLLADAYIHYIFRISKKTDDEGMLVIGEARKLSNRERDIYDYDFEICVHKKTWQDANRRRKERIAWHELNHCIVIFNKIDNSPAINKSGRLKIRIKPHDIVIKTFEEELFLFGPDSHQTTAIESINKYLRRKRKIKRRR